jgi:HEAT repeat protein
VATAAVLLVLLLHGCNDRVDKLARMLECGSWCDRSKAVKALGVAGDERAIRYLVRALDDSNWRVRRQAVRSLSNSSATGVTGHIIERLTDDAWQVRLEAVRALSKAADPRASEALVSSLQDSNRRVRTEVARVLVHAGHRDAVDALAEALADWHAGKAIASALKELGWLPETDQQRVHLWVAMQQGDSLRFNWRRTKSVLLADIDSNSSLKVENALNVLVCIGNTEVLQELIDALARTDSQSLAEVFAHSGQPRLREAAAAWAHDRNVTLTRHTAVRPVVWGSWSLEVSRPTP